MKGMGLKNLKQDAIKSPFFHLGIVTLFSAGFVSLPLNQIFELFLDKTTSAYLGGIILRLMLSAVALFFIYKYKFEKALNLKGYKGQGLLTFIIALIVCINNFPIIALATGEVALYANALQIVAFIVYCLSVGIFEEVVFRGIVFPLALLIVKKTKNQVFWSSIISGTAFAIIHLLNLFAGQGILATLMQIGYSFLIGCMCSIVTAKTGKLIFAIILHSVYDVGGLFTKPIGLQSNHIAIAQGFQWDTITIIITAVLGTLVAIYMLITAIKAKHQDLILLYDLTENDTENNDLEKSD